MSTLTQGFEPSIVQRRLIYDNFLPEGLRLAIIRNTYNKIRNPLWHLFLLFRPRNVGTTTDTVPVETDSDRLVCVGHTCPSTDEQAQQKLRTLAFRQSLELFKQVRC
jgi:hypothetical protein